MLRICFQLKNISLVFLVLFSNYNITLVFRHIHLVYAKHLFISFLHRTRCSTNYLLFKIANIRLFLFMFFLQKLFTQKINKNFRSTKTPQTILLSSEAKQLQKSNSIRTILQFVSIYSKYLQKQIPKKIIVKPRKKTNTFVTKKRKI